MNKQTFMKVIILLGYGALMFYLIFSGEITMYMNPKMNGYILACAIFFVLIAVFMLKDIFKKSDSKTGMWTYSVFILPLLLAFIVPPISMSSSVAQSRGITIFNEAGNNLKSKGSVSEEAQTMENQDYNNGVDLVLNAENYIYMMDTIYANPTAYNDSTIELDGFVYKGESNLNEDEFILGRSLITCCIADTNIYGIICKSDAAKEIEDDEWVRVTGRLKDTIWQGYSMPMIVVDKYEVVERPENEYLYP